MQQKIALLLIIVSFVSGSIITGTMAFAADKPEGQPFQAIWGAIGLIQEETEETEQRLDGIYVKEFENQLFGFTNPNAVQIKERTYNCDGDDTVISGGYEGIPGRNNVWAKQSSFVDGENNQYVLEFAMSSTVFKITIDKVHIVCLPN